MKIHIEHFAKRLKLAGALESFEEWFTDNLKTLLNMPFHVHMNADKYLINPGDYLLRLSSESGSALILIWKGESGGLFKVKISFDLETQDWVAKVPITSLTVTPTKESQTIKSQTLHVILTDYEDYLIKPVYDPSIQMEGQLEIYI